MKGYIFSSGQEISSLVWNLRVAYRVYALPPLEYAEPTDEYNTQCRNIFV